MRTNFNQAQLDDVALAAAERELRACVHCGMCTATCPTYALLGDELDGPRGRIQLIQGMLESGAAPSAKVVKHIDRCLSCLACVSACPSGVNYPRLIDEARVHIERSYSRPWLEAVMRRMLGAVLPRRAWLRSALMLGRIGSQFEAILPQQMRAMVRAAQALPKPPRARSLAKSYGGKGRQARRLALHTGCVQEVLAPSITAATVRVLTRLGAEVTIVEGEGCCGALNHHLGQKSAFERRAHSLVADIAEAQGSMPFDSIVTTASGCGAVIRDYGFLLQSEGAKAVGGRVRDISDVLADLVAASTMTAPMRLRVAYHAACSLTHGMRQGSRVPQMLAKLGFEVLLPSDTNCCGSAGVYNVLQPEIAGALQQRKAKALGSLKPDVVATGNIGCMMQIGSAMQVPVVHVVELVDWATGGPMPAAMRPRA